MKFRFFSVICFASCVLHTFCQPSQQDGLYIPFVSKESQSNVVVLISDLGAGQPSTDKLTNSLSNTNLFPISLRQRIENTLSQYKSVTPIQGPLGTVLVSSYKTNYIFHYKNTSVKIDETVSTFQYTNCVDRETIRFGSGLLAEYRTPKNDGYSVSFTRTGSGTLFGFGEIRNGQPNGVFARFSDSHPQGTNWSYRDADFANFKLCEYRTQTNGFVIGEFLMWNISDNNILVHAKFTEPFDLKQHSQQR